MLKFPASNPVKSSLEEKLNLEQQQCASRGIQLNYNELPYCETSDRIKTWKVNKM